MSPETTTNYKAIKLNAENINFSHIREKFKKDHDIRRELNWGKAILNTRSQLEQYFYTYGPMVATQWKEIKKTLQLGAQQLDIIDYGCGQGLGTIQIFDQLRSLELPNHTTSNVKLAKGNNKLDQVINVNLIDPSDIALSNAHHILKHYPMRAKLNFINKKLDDLSLSNINFSESSAKIHIFSNILDIDTFDHLALLKRVLSVKGKHCVIAVSPWMSDKGIRMQETYASILAAHKIEHNKKWEFKHRTQRHNAFIIDLEV